MDVLDKGIVCAISNNRNLVVGSTYPGGEVASKGSAVRRLKSYVSWVQTVNQSLLLLAS